MSKRDKRRRASNYEDDENFVPKAFQKKNKTKDEKEANKENIDVKNSKNKKQKGKRKKEKDVKNKKIKKAILILLAIIVIAIGISIAIATNTWKTLVKEMFNNQNSEVIDTSGNTIAKLGSERKNLKVSLKEMPNNLKNAYVSIEDERFYSHHGVDVKRTSAAICSYVIHFGSSSYGGSTITQQLVKNLTGDSTDSITRKVKEWWKAWQLETCFDKDEILEEYLNVIYVGPNMYGVETAAKYYFNKSVSNLTLEECAFLAGLNNSPNSYNPFDGSDKQEKIKKRTKTVLAKMLELKKIEKSEYDDAVAEVDSGLKFKKGQIDSGDEGVYSYHSDALITEVTTDIAKKYNISETFANNYLCMAHLTINSNQDTKVQKEMEKEFEKSKYSLASKNGGNSSQAAMVVIDHKTGYVVGCTGGLGKKTTARSLNRATQSIRQTGSAIKPIAVLAPSISKKIITASTICNDTERDFADGYHPTDYSNQLGEITVRRAVESSQNIPFVEIMEKLKPKNAMNFLEKLGVTTLTEEDNTLVLSLGGLQRGISPLQMAGAYSAIANDGVYIEPTFYSSIKNKNGKEILKTKQVKRRVFSKDVAYILKELLTQPVNGANGTATYCKISGVDVAAKTGTTDENYDRWLCGFTPYYTAVTWYGYDQNETILYNNRNPAGLLWANVMSRIHSGLKGAKFEKPTTVTSCTICSETGKKATTGCTNTYTEYYLWGTVPGVCNKHAGSELDSNNSNSNDNSLQNKIQDVVQGITEDIDAEDPQEKDRRNKNNSGNSNKTTQNNTNTNASNSSSNTTNNKPTNDTTNKNTDKNNSSVVNSNSSNSTTNTNTNTTTTNNTNSENTKTNTTVTNNSYSPQQ